MKIWSNLYWAAGWNRTKSNLSSTATGDFTKSVWEMLCFFTLFSLSIYPYAHKKLTQTLLNPFHEFPCSWRKLNLAFPVLLVKTWIWLSIAELQVEIKLKHILNCYLNWTKCKAMLNCYTSRNLAKALPFLSSAYWN